MHNCWIEVRNRPRDWSKTQYSKMLREPDTDWHRLDSTAVEIISIEVCVEKKFAEWVPMASISAEQAVVILKNLAKQADEMPILLDWKICNPEAMIPGEALGLC